MPDSTTHHVGGPTTSSAQRYLSYCLLIIGSTTFIIPFLWMVATSLKDSHEVFSYPPSFLPTSFNWWNYQDGWEALPFTRFFINSVIVTVASMAGALVSSILCAYAFARLRSRLRATLFALLLATMMIPGEIMLVPQFVMFSAAGWVNTYWPLILPSWLGVAFYIFLLRQFFMSIPTELDDAARIDGASDMRILWSILVPLSKPAIAAVAIFSFVASWNNILGPIIYLRSLEKYTMAVGLKLFHGQHYTAYNQAMAVSVVSLIPIIVVFLLAQKHFIKGVTLSGIGGR